MDDDPARELPLGSGRVGGRSGCMAALLFAFPTGSVVLLGATLGDCAGDPSCPDGKTRLLVEGLAIMLGLAALFGVAIRVLVRRSRLRGTNAAPRAWLVALAIPVALVLGLLAIWCELAILGVL